MSGFRVPFQAADSEFVEKRSRFISHIWPVETEEQAQQYIKDMKAKYYDARHNCATASAPPPPGTATTASLRALPDSLC